MDISKQMATKIEQIAEQLRLAISEYPNRIALDRIKFALSLTHFVSAQIYIDKNATIPDATPPDSTVSDAPS